MSAEPLEEIADCSNEPNWVQISLKYAELHYTTKELSSDIARYNDALKELDAAGTSIHNAKERIYLLKEAIAQMENAA